MIVRCVVLAAALGVAGLRAPEPATVSAAISLTDVLQAIARAYEAGGAEPVRFNFGGSNVLARQIVSGAPVDLFVSADEAQIDVAAAAGAIDAKTRVDLVGNRLAVIVGRDGPSVESVRALLRPEIRRIAIGDPAAVPAGVYARQYLQAEGIWDALQPKLVPVSNVRAAVAAVDNGSVDAALAYQTDARAASRAKIALTIAGPSAPRIVYPAAIVAGSRHRAAAERFLSFLRGAEAAAIFRTYQFIPLTAGG